MLKAMGIEEEKIEQIIDAHTESTDALKSERNSLKEKAEQFDAVKAELDELKSKPAEDWKEKHDKVKKEFDDFKADLTNKETLKTKKTAYSALLDSIGIKDAVVKENAMLKANYDEMELDGENIKDANKHTESLKNTYADYIEVSGTKGSSVDHPPQNNNSKTKDEIMAITDRAERRAEIAKNLSLFEQKEG